TPSCVKIVTRSSNVTHASRGHETAAGTVTMGREPAALRRRPAGAVGRARRSRSAGRSPRVEAGARRGPPARQPVPLDGGRPRAGAAPLPRRVRDEPPRAAGGARSVACVRGRPSGELARAVLDDRVLAAGARATVAAPRVGGPDDGPVAA